MNLDNYNKWFTLVTNLGVLAGIIFLAIELRQNNELMSAQDRFNRLTIGTSGSTALIQRSDLADIFVKARNSELNEVESLVYEQYVERVFKNWEWTYYEIPRAEIPVRRWQVFFELNPAVIAIWQRRNDQYRKEFVQFVIDSIVNEP